MKEDIARRREAILEAVVDCYIDSARPVGSRVIARKMGLSSATIRNVMQDLEEEGFIMQPHTSAGRVPTEKGYRYYVDSLMRLRRLTEAQKRNIDSEYAFKMKSLEDLLAKTSHIISMVTGCAGVVLLPKTEYSHFRHIELVSISRNKILVLLVAGSGIAKDFIIDTDYYIDSDTLDRITKFLNDSSYDMTLDEIKDHLEARLRAERDYSYKIIEQARNIMSSVLMSHIESKLYIDGASHILVQPEFSDARRIKAIIEFLEDKERMLELLLGDVREIGTRILIGSESRVRSLNDMSIITSGYRIKDNIIGRVGVIGPTRMSYEKVVPIVNFLADTLTGMLRELEV